MKIKNLYVIAIGVFSFLFIVFLVIVPFFLFYSYFWTATTIVLVLVIILLIIYIINTPGHKMQNFYNHDPIVKIQKLIGQKFNYKKSKYRFLCSSSILQMVLEKHGIHKSHDEILSLSGNNELGTTAEELQKILNEIFVKNSSPLCARIQYETTYSQLFDAIINNESVIVMFINSFYEKGYSSKASYPHFGLLNYIDLSSIKTQNGKVVITNPSFSEGISPHFVSGKYEGEIVMSVHEFQERFYMTQKYFKRLRHKPTSTLNIFVNNWNRIINFLFIFAMYVGYCTKTIQPGLAIFIGSMKK